MDASCCLGVPWKVPWYSAKRIFWNILKFHGDYLKRWLRTHRVSQILLLTRLISEIKESTAPSGFLSTVSKLTKKKVQKLHFESQFPARLSSSWRKGEQTRPRGLSSSTFNNKWVSIIKLHWHHRHLRNIDCLVGCTACLVSFTSTVNGHSKKKGLKMWR